MSIFTWIIPAAPTPAVPTTEVGAVDHVETAIGRLRAWARGKTAIEAVLRGLLAEAAAIEEQLTALRDQRSVDTATGANLTVLGKIVDEPRAGASDDDYRRRIRARIAINRSSGIIDQILRVVRLVLNDSAATVTAINYGGAEATITLGAVAVPLALADQVAASAREATASGVMLQVISSAAAPAASLLFDIGTTTLDVHTMHDAH